VRHHYEKLDRQLDGFLVVGDALCSFNPIYGQGLTVAALEAQVLHRLLADDAGTTDLPRRFFREVAQVVDTPWGLATAADLRFPEVAGKRRPMHALLDGYLQRYRAAASVDPGLGTTLLRVVNLLEPAKRLQRPGPAVRVFRAARSARKSVVEPPANGLDDIFVDLPDGFFGDLPAASPVGSET
jgi:2-polyprenyl-6-methoxyphenol hydroxylase-like FAD-dependent oxidoreductase